MDVLQWNRDRVSGSLTDNDARIIDIATRQHPSILTGLSLDIDFLTDQGIETIQNVLDCSKLEYLRIHSEPLKPDIEHSVGKALQAALQAVQWSMVKYLVIVGSDVDSWIRVWADQGCLLESTIGHQLQTLKVIVEEDWEFIIGAVDFTLIETISMCNTGIDGTNRQKTLFGEHYDLLTPLTEGLPDGSKSSTSSESGYSIDKDALAVDTKNYKKGG
ncbi:hypothetical protein BGZ93_006684 [Podila epicladia]|nr:hypothetical protein BGZ93_006684 [Podila epicladia]